MLRDAADVLAQRAVNTRLSTQPGASSFFAKPDQRLDPHLFLRMSGDYRLWPEVRSWILTTLYEFWAQKGYKNPQHWSRVWIAGSGVTYQWNAARSVGEPGDLDVLIGVNFPGFWTDNPVFHGLGEQAQSEYFNDQFRSELDLRTAHTNFGGQTYEVTFYVNPSGWNILDINPYAAYNVSADNWTVRPPDLASDWDPERVLPQDWWASFAADERRSVSLTHQFNSLTHELRQFQMGDPRWINTATALHHVIWEAASLFNDIHTRRHDSFQPGGGGFLGFSNVRWQTAKRDGYLHNLHTLKDLWTSAHATTSMDCLGRVPLDAAHALMLAMLVGAGIE
jgi:hypothetical protein